MLVYSLYRACWRRQLGCPVAMADNPVIHYHFPPGSQVRWQLLPDVGCGVDSDVVYAELRVECRFLQI